MNDESDHCSRWGRNERMGTYTGPLILTISKIWSVGDVDYRVEGIQNQSELRCVDGGGWECVDC